MTDSHNMTHTIRFRVTGETFVDTGPKAPLAAETEVEETRAAPYRCHFNFIPNQAIILSLQTSN